MALNCASDLVSTIEGILNFTPTPLGGEDVAMVSVDLAIELEQLTFAVVNRRKNA